MSYYDPEATIQDADIEQAEWEREACQSHAARLRGICQHNSAVSYRVPVVYPEQVGLRPGEMRCTEGCKRVFGSDEEWVDAMRDAADS